MQQSGGFAVTAQLTTPGGGPLGDRISLQVKSTAYGSISLIITIGAAVLLGLLFLRRLVNFILRRRRAAAAAPDRAPPEGAPARSAEPEPGVRAGPEDDRPVAVERRGRGDPARRRTSHRPPHRMPPPPPPRPVRERSRPDAATALPPPPYRAAPPPSTPFGDPAR